MNKIKTLLWKLLQLCIFLYGAVAVGLYFFQEKLLFHPSVIAADYQFQISLPFEERTLEVDGENIHSLLLKAPMSQGLILMFHGNANDLSQWAETAENLAKRLSWDIWIMDYPGFGKSTGKIRSEAQLHFIAKAFFDAAQKEARDRSLVLYGRSIGTGFALKLASTNPVTAVVLESPYLSMSSLAKSVYPWAPLFLLRYSIRSDHWMPLVKAPILVLHGDQDEIIPFESGFALAELSTRAKLVTLNGGRHNDLRRHPEYWSEFAAFLGGLKK